MKNEHKIEIILKGKEWSSILDSVFEITRKEVKVDGFRKGQVPKEMYIKKFGIESLYMDAVDAAIPVAYNKMLKEQKLIPVVQPKVDIKDINEESITLEFIVITKPEVKLGAYKNLKIKKEEAKVTEKEVKEEIEEVRKKMADTVIKENGAVVKGNTVTLDFKGFVDGQELEGGSGENFPLEIGSNTFIPGFEDGVVGMKVGEEKELNLKFPEDYVENLKNKEVLFKVTVKEIKEKVLPEINKELFLDLGYEDVKTEKEFAARIEKDLLEQKQQKLDDDYLEKVLEKAIENLTVEVNEEIVEDEVNRMLSQFAEQLQYQGMSLDQYYEFSQETELDLRAKMSEEALKRIKSRYLLEAVAEKEKIEVTDAGADEEAEKLATLYQMPKEELLKMFGGLETMKFDTKMRRALDLLRK